MYFSLFGAWTSAEMGQIPVLPDINARYYGGQEWLVGANRLDRTCLEPWRSLCEGGLQQKLLPRLS